MGGHRSIKPIEPRGPWRPVVRVWDENWLPTLRPWDARDWALKLFSNDWSDGLVAVRRLRDLILQHETRHVAAARDDGAGWEGIARRLGVTRQAAQQKWLRRRRHPSVRYPSGMSLDDLYREVILDHYRSPRNKRGLPDAQIDVHRNNPLCGDDITVRVVLRDGVATDVAFEGQGCSISQASASMLTEQIKGKTPPEIDDLVAKFRKMMAGDETMTDEELGDLVALKGVVKYPVRIKCAVLAWDALQEGVSAAPTTS